MSAKDFINSCWFAFKWGLLAALLAAAALAVYFYSRVNDEIRLRVQAKLQSHYTNLIVTVRSAQLVDGEGIEVRGLTLLDPHATGPQAELAYFDEMVLFCQTSLPELVKGEPKISSVLIRRPTLHSTRRPDGTWSLSRLLPLPKFSDRPLPATVEGATLEFFDPLRTPASTFTLRDINLEAKPMPAPGEPGVWLMEVRGYSAGDHFQRVEFAGQFGPQFKGFDIGGVLMGLDVSPDMTESLPGELASRLGPLAPLRGQARIGFRLHDNPGGPAPYLFQIAGELTGGRFDDARLPYPLTDLKAEFRVDNGGIAIDEVMGRAGQATFRLSGRVQGFGVGAPLHLQAHTEHLLIGRQWETVLPEKLLDGYRKFLPAGEIDADLTLDYDGLIWQPDLNVALRNVSVTYHRFPYRLDRVAGTVRLRNNHMSLGMAGFAAGQRIDVTGEFDNPGENFTGDLQVRGANIPFDENLFAAMPEKPRAVLQSLNPAGTFDFVLHTQRTDGTKPPSPNLIVKLNRGAVRYEKFPYPISDIHGVLIMTDNRWTFRDLEGVNGPGRIHCEGFFNPSPPPETTGGELQLHFTATNVPLQDELRDALPPQSRHVWNNTKPQGAINLRTADLRYNAGTKKAEINFRAEPVDETTSIQPGCFPYRLERLRGAIVYREGHIDLENMHAVHDRTPFETSGFVDFDHEGNWHMRLDRLTADRLHVDRDFLAAMQGKLKKAVVDLNPAGPINAAGTLDFYGSAKPDAPIHSAWNMTLDVHQGSVGGTLQIENVNGGVRLVGDYDGQHVRCQGALAIDSLTFKDFQFTQVQGPLYFDEKQMLFGATAQQQQPNQPPPHITAKVYGGALQSDCTVTLADKSRFSLQALLTDGDLKRFAHEAVSGKQKIDGKVLASINVSGDTSGVHSLNGRGQIRLTDADIYQLPFMASMLKLLSVKPPDSTAFTNSSIEYRIEGDHVYLDKVAFNGDVISLEGSGEMDFDSSIRATFHTLVGRSDWQLPVLKTVMGAASRQLMQIHVTGTLANPKMTRDVLPAVSQAIQQAQTNVQSMDRPLYPQVRGAAPGVER